MASKEVAIEVEPFPRENMIDAAVKFLNNPGVRAAPTARKESFLKKKGLTNEEIRTAFERSNGELNALPYGHEAYLSQPKQGAIPPMSWLHKSTRILDVAVLLFATTYGLYYLYKSYIGPFLFGRGKKPKSIENSIQDINETMKKTLSELKSEMNNIQAELNKLLSTQTEQARYITEINQLKSEVVTVKGILLSRHQFPSVNLSTTSIPAWQLTGSSHKDDKEIAESEDVEHNSGSSETEIVPNSNRNGGSQGSDSSLEMIKEVDT